jgi:hypothetical protein
MNITDRGLKGAHYILRATTQVCKTGPMSNEGYRLSIQDSVKSYSGRGLVLSGCLERLTHHHPYSLSSCRCETVMNQDVEIAKAVLHTVLISNSDMESLVVGIKNILLNSPYTLQ